MRPTPNSITRLAARLVGLAWLLGLLSSNLPAQWPDRVFAPYMYLGSGDNFLLTRCDDECAQKFYTLAFIISDKSNQPAWDGQIPMGKNLYAEQIRAIRQRGGDVLVSFGGEAGTELAIAETDPAALESKYESVLKQYHLTWLDFDIEGKALAKTESNQRRNTALAAIQKRNPILRVSYTLPVDPNGISDHAQKLLTDAKARGLHVYSANIMTMDFGASFSRDKALHQVCIASALKAREQCQKIDPDLLIGLTPMIGQNDVKTEIFTQQDAQKLRTWAETQPWIASLSFWSVNRDNGKAPGKNDNTHSNVAQDPWAFTRIFQPFTTATSGHPATPSHP